MPDPAPHPAEVNMADVAERAGVSIATVSRALRDVPGVSEPTRERIRAIAHELAYVVSPEASQLSRRQTGRVAVVVPKIDIWYYSAMLASIEQVLREADLDVLVYQVDGERQRSRFFRQLPARRKVDGVALIALPLLAEEEQRLDLLGVHVVVAGGRLRDYPHVRTDDRSAALQAVGHLLSLGHRDIAMIRTSDTAGAARSADVDRTDGYRQSLVQAGIEPRDDYLVTRPLGVLAGADGIDALLALDRPPTAVFAYSDELAISALHRLRERGLRVPDDMSIVSVDGHPMAELFGLSTVGQSVHAQGRLSGEMILAKVRGHVLDETAVVVPPRLVVRRTTAPPSGGPARSRPRRTRPVKRPAAP
ncbi:MAG: Transcriptional regulator, LacI family [uncultured Nocardioides sp.]|uniref:Transcriptional regulator, LacI family n=1 Tax=uncultured Nocardioides sp. TaxID=198441 RepID=A0A6J4PAA8_9ACTN|nr:MAG: Transcriptional regulator, LacI family [uncultured Nocardioides sp.]